MEELRREVSALRTRIAHLESASVKERLAPRDLEEMRHVIERIVSEPPVGIAQIADGKILSADDVLKKMLGFDTEEDSSGKALATIFATPTENERVERIVREAIEADSSAETHAELQRTDGSTFKARVKIAALDRSESRNAGTLVISDVTAKQASEAILRRTVTDLVNALDRQAGRGVRELSKFQALYALAVAMTIERSLADNLSLVVETTRTLLATDAAFLTLADEDAGDLYMNTWSGIETEAFKTLRIPFGAALGGKVAATGTGYIIEDYFLQIEPLLHETVRAEGLVSVVAAPIQTDHTIVGVLYAANRRKTSFSESDLNTLGLLGNLAAIEIIHKRTLSELRAARNELETRVEERTAALSRTNEQLSQEILERRRIETDLMNQLLFFQTLIDTIPSPIYYKNVAGQYLGCNSAYESYRGVTRDWLIGKTISEVLPPDHAQKRLAKDRELLENPGIQIYEDSDLHSDGTFHDLMFNKATFCNADGTVAGLAGVIIDITERKRAEEELRASEERFRAIFETAQDSIFIKGPDLRYTHVNPAMLRLLDVPASSIIGRTDEELLGLGQQQAGNLKDIELRVLKGQIIEEQHSLVVKGNRIILNCIRVPIKNSADENIGLCGIARDITERTERVLEGEIQEFEYESRVMRSTLAKARLAAGSESIILLLGESGSGKDYLARYIHDSSKRASGPFFTINCAALPPELAESELFGHEPGAFTGAHGRKRGLLELAEGGTLLLNEIGELSPYLQAKLLTFLDTQSFNRVGGEKKISVNARLIAATNRDLKKEVDAGRFREDLFYRLDVFSIEVPPLRNRTEDLPLLAAELLRDMSKRIALERPPSLESAALQALAAYNWPGNVRELRNVLERALILCDKKRIKLGDLSVNAEIAPAESGAEEWSVKIGFPRTETLNQVARDVKRLLVLEALRRSRGSRTGAARLLGITPDALKHYMRTFDLYD